MRIWYIPHMWENVEHITLCGRSQTHKVTCCIITHIWTIQRERELSNGCQGLGMGQWGMTVKDYGVSLKIFGARYWQWLCNTVNGLDAGESYTFKDVYIYTIWISFQLKKSNRENAYLSLHLFYGSRDRALLSWVLWSGSPSAASKGLDVKAGCHLSCSGLFQIQVVVARFHLFAAVGGMVAFSPRPTREGVFEFREDPRPSWIGTIQVRLLPGSTPSQTKGVCCP